MFDFSSMGEVQVGASNLARDGLAPGRFCARVIWHKNHFSDDLAPTLALDYVALFQCFEVIDG